MIGKKRKLGKKVDELQIGDTYTASRSIEDKELLLYLGLTNDANPLYIQHDYASQTPYKQPVVPSLMLFGMVSSIVSMHLPGPGSHISQHEMKFSKPVYHYAEVTFRLEVIAIDADQNEVTLSVNGYDDSGESVLHGRLNVQPAYEPQSLTGRSLENFF